MSGKWSCRTFPDLIKEVLRDDAMLCAVARGGRRGCEPPARILATFRRKSGSDTLSRWLRARFSLLRAALSHFAPGVNAFW
jgi:hypothetical protein